MLQLIKICSGLCLGTTKYLLLMFVVSLGLGLGLGCLSLDYITEKSKVFPHSSPSVRPGADPGVEAVSPQVVGCHYL